ncbi:MAG TPA: archaellin/type IV pilin N-terminal domain-containing protein [archaeon]|nr:archaellin/type IV pilin N-terminal domain-containing protein [archaeon]
MKGITPVISTILLLLITVALIGAVYTFFMSQTELTTKSVGEGTQNTLNAVNTKVRIVFVQQGSPIKIYVRNTGTVTIKDNVDLNNILTVFVDGTLASGFWKSSDGSVGVTEIPVGSTVLFNAADADGACASVKIDTLGQSASSAC